MGHYIGHLFYLILCASPVLDVQCVPDAREMHAVVPRPELWGEDHMLVLRSIRYLGLVTKLVTKGGGPVMRG